MNKHNITPFILYALSFSYLEILLRIFTIKPFLGAGLFLSVLFAFVLAGIFSAATYIIPKKLRKHFIGLVLLLSTILHVSQIIYYSYFKTYFTIFSMANADEVKGFWKDIILEIVANLVPVILCFLVIGIYIILLKKVEVAFPSKKVIKVGVVIVAVSLLLFIVATAITPLTPNSPKDALFKTNNIAISIPNLGLDLGLVLDSGRLIFGFNPKVDFDKDVSEENFNETEILTYNKMDIDFDALIESETNSTRRLMHQYFSSQIPTRQNGKTGIFKGKNLVFVCGESFSSFAVNEKYTPTLYKMANEGYNFTNFYNPIWGVSTSDGEYVQTVGLLPKTGVWSMRESSTRWLPFTMGNQFSKIDYRTLAYHNHYAEYYGRTSSHPNLGYKYKGLGTGLKVKEQWPESDLEMIDLTTGEFIGQEPWHVYYMTVSGHKNYNWSGQMMTRIHKDDVADLDMSEGCKAYVACNMELDLAMKLLIERLDQAGELENTVFVISGDHYPYGLTLEEISEFLGHTVETEFELYKSTLIIWTPSMEPETVTKYSSTIDIIPTISNLFGLEYDSRLLSGRDIFSTQDPLVMFSDRSFITKEGRYNARMKTSEGFDDMGNIVPGETLPSEYIEYVNNTVSNKFYFAKLILEEDYYKYVIPRWPAPVR